MKTTTFENQTIWYNSSLCDVGSSSELAKLFSVDYWHSQHLITGQAQGRGTTYFVQLESIQGALRHYHRGGLFGKLVNDHYLFTGWLKTRSAQEFALLEHLNNCRVNVPKPIAARAVKRGFIYTADILIEKVPNASDLVDILLKATLSAEHYQKIGREIRKMHDVGVDHTDLNIHNILIDDNHNVWLIDFDKCRLSRPDTFEQGNLERLLRSFRKEVGKRQIKWCEKDWVELVRGYELGARNKG